MPPCCNYGVVCPGALFCLGIHQGNALNSYPIIGCHTELKEEKNMANLQEYWRRNLKIMSVLLGIWFFVSYFCGILIVDVLNKIQIAGFPLGFWFAQQGAMFVFVALIFIYCRLMEKLDKEFDVHE
jgi:putative solute:sodium symporter small subunit